MVSDPSELSDWRLPLSFMKPRHGSESSVGDQDEESWRMKERVSLSVSTEHAYTIMILIRLAHIH